MRGFSRLRVNSAALVSGLALLAPASRAEDAIGAELSCARRSDPGRVGCELTLRSNSDTHTLRWVDGLIVEAPDFLQPLRARVTSELPSEGRAKAIIPLAFLASQLGSGFVSIEVRSVLCPAGAEQSRGCIPAVVRISKQITVG